MIEIYDVNESFTHININGDIEYGKIIIDTLSVFEEGYQFSPLFRSGAWNGKKEFFSILGGGIIQIPKGLINYILKDLRSRNKEYTYKTSTTKNIIDEKEYDEFIKSLNIPFEPYDYQRQAALDMIQDKRMVVKAATGAGKSLIIYIFCMWMLKENKNVILVVPSIGLVTQMAADFEDYGWKNKDRDLKQIGGEFKGKKDLSEKPLVLSTWQSLQYMKKSEFEIFDAIIVDEAHKVRGEVLNNITQNAINADFKLGLTGTIPRTRVDKLQLLGTLGNVNNVINAGGLIARGLATDVDINCIYLKHSNFMVDEFYRNTNQKPKYPDEEKYLGTDITRNRKAAKLLMKISQSGNTIGLFTKTAHGELMLKMVIEERTGNGNFDLLHKFTPKSLEEAYEEFQKDKTKLFYVNKKIELPDRKKLKKNIDKIALDEKDAQEFIDNIKSLDDENIFFYNGSVDAETREYIRQKLEIIDKDHQTPAIVIANYSVMSTGISIKNLHNVVLLSSLKAYTTIVQVIGRLLRLHKSKPRASMYDFVDIIDKVGKRGSVTQNYVQKHFYQRLAYYQEEGYSIREKEINL